MEEKELTRILFDIHAKVTAIEALQKNDHDLLFGNGQPGVLHHFNTRIESIETFRDKALGRNSVFAAIATAASLFGTELFHRLLWRK